MKLFITGVSGLLGINLALQLRNNYQITGTYLSHPVSIAGCHTMPIDMASPGELTQAIEAARPHVIINTVALTDVERCESEVPLADTLNRRTARDVALAASNIGAKLVHISTDHLSDGTKSWMTETDEPSPLNIYAKTKYQGELAVLDSCPGALVIRTNFFGWGTFYRASFSDWILDKLATNLPLNMFVDSYFTPILINDLIDLIEQLIDSSASGVFNVGGSERVSKYEFGIKLAQTFKYPTESINASSIHSLQSNVIRPQDMSLNSNKLEALLQKELPTLNQSLDTLKHLKRQGWPEILKSKFTRLTTATPEL